MATAPQRPPQQGAPAQQEPPKQVSPLDNLQAMMNLVLITSGRYLKEQRDGGGSGRTQFGMKRTIPAAFERFHDSLDELEMEVRQAQAVLRRDLALLQADRIQREQAEAAERQRLAAASSAKKLAPVRPEPAAAPPEPLAAQPKAAAEQLPPTEESSTAEKKAAELPPPIATNDVPERDPLFDPTPTTGNPQDTEFDFEAMFGDSLDDVGDASNNQDVDMDASGADLSFTMDDSGPSLLRGLEEFAKAGDEGTGDTNMDIDFAMPDLPDLGTTQPPPQPTAPKVESPPAVQPPPPPAETADQFDTMATDSFDDLFNMDGEPESTEFDDAFFGFGAD
ncbi:hypothetical protein P154DRAFT_518349 [Amniculicola lignicola CBS 123094]|uniref:Uncharacterized protein n=1 Tax=Amniculicola lignicola CBS 123094 TaxID=1392246 RepID=A0A6A5WVG4_9PLEO|nr:hypothetical protein P154DRAFT_518349 [Amniculicola lignicola CBS 123094]